MTKHVFWITLLPPVYFALFNRHHLQLKLIISFISQNMIGSSPQKKSFQWYFFSHLPFIEIINLILFLDFYLFAVQCFLWIFNLVYIFLVYVIIFLVFCIFFNFVFTKFQFGIKYQNSIRIFLFSFPFL